MTVQRLLFYLEMESSIECQTDSEKASAQGRIKESQIFVLTRRFRDVMNQYSQEAMAHRERCKKVILRELEICMYYSSVPSMHH